MAMLLYSALLGTALVVSAPVWAWRMLRGGRYREGLRQRLGAVPAELLEAVRGRRVVWVHAVSVGEVLAGERLVRELGETLGPEWCVVISTTTATGQRIARERFGAERVFFWPLDFGWIVRQYLRALRPEMLLLVESELWPRMLRECQRAGVPVAVVNARMSDRSFARAQRVPALWRWMAGGVTAFLAQGEETAGRLRALGAGDVRVSGNLKYDLRDTGSNPTARWLRNAAEGRRVVVAGSTLEGEETMLLDAFKQVLADEPEALLVLAPRHPQRFEEVASLLGGSEGKTVRATSAQHECRLDNIAIVLLDTLGDLASVYGVAQVAFVGGSLVSRGGHNPLEAARFGVPVVMGTHYENFREIVDGMQAAEAIRITGPGGLADALTSLLRDGEEMGERGRSFFESQAGATGRTVAALREMLRA